MADAEPAELPDFEAFLTRKKIHAQAFALARPAEYARYADAYAQQGPVSFDHSTKFLLNDWRLDFPLAPATGAARPDGAAPAAAPPAADAGTPA